jgi:Pyruvate phosphate dikinase, AMP/ATP-binding domain
MENKFLYYNIINSIMNPIKNYINVNKKTDEISFTVSAFKKDLVWAVLSPEREAWHIDSIDEIDFSSLPLWWKTANLMELQNYAAKVGYKVPEWYGVWYDAYSQYMSMNKSKGLEETTELPNLLIDLVLKMKEDLWWSIAIRSSWNVEDGESASAAWVFESMYIDWSKVRLEDGRHDFENEYAAVEYVVRRIYDTTRSPWAIEYFAKNNVDAEKINMGLTIQKLVQTPLVAGVMLTKEDTDGKRWVNVNYVTHSFGNVIADWTAPWSTLDTIDHNVLAQRVVPNTNKRNTLSNIGHFVVRHTAHSLTGGILDAYGHPDWDIEFAIDQRELDKFIINYEERYKTQLEAITSHLTIASWEKEANEFLTTIDNISKKQKELISIKQTTENNSDEEKAKKLWLEISLLLRKTNKIIEKLNIIIDNLPDTPINNWIKEQLGKFFMQFVSVLQYRRLVRPFPKFNPNAKWSLNSIFMTGDPVTWVCVCIDEFKTIAELEETILNYKKDWKKIILVWDAPWIESERALMLSDAVLLQSSWSWSHIALRAWERGKESIGWLNISNINTGMEVIVDATEISVIDQATWENILTPLFASGNINEEFIKSHIDNVEEYINYEEPSVDRAIKDLKEKMLKACDAETWVILSAILDDNAITLEQAKPDVYTEEWFDSCQTRRRVSKVIAELMLVSWTMYERSLLGEDISLENAQWICGSTIIIDKKYEDHLISIAEKYWDNQEFLFPWVSPSSKETPHISEYMKDLLNGNPKPSVRAVTWLGGLRDDKEENHTVDFKQFLELKMKEDKRYYPGVVSLNLLLEKNIDEIPLITTIKEEYPNVYANILELKSILEWQKSESIDDAALLCAAYLPNNISQNVINSSYPKNSDLTYTRLLQAFHSPRSELDAFQKLLQSITNGEKISEEEIGHVFEPLKMQAGWMKTFNSTLHIPWASGLAKLSNGLIGNIKTKEWVSVTRYGIWYNNKSLEVLQYDLPWWLVSYEVKEYDNKLFNWEAKKTYIMNNEMKESIEEIGFLKTASSILWE